MSADGADGIDVGRGDIDLLVVGAHPDDAEIGLGGTLALAASGGRRCAILDLTDGEPTPRGTVETRLCEAAAAADVLGVERRTLDLPNRYLFDTRGARESVASVLREWRPRVVAVPWWEDAHPDHLAASRIVEAARFYAKFSKTDMPGEPFYVPRFIYYFASHLRTVPQPGALLDVSAGLERKMSALDSYSSQFGEGAERERFMGWVRDGAAMWGALVGVAAAEPVMVREPLGLVGLEAVL